MTRPIRIEQAGGWYHLTARGNERKAIYRDDRDRQHFCYPRSAQYNRPQKANSYVQPSVFDMLAGASPASATDGWAE